MNIELRDRVAIVTGASDGIGLATAREFARVGVRLVLAARSEKALQRLAAELGGEERALAVYTDMADTYSVQRMVQRAIAHFGQVDILVNNAGIGYFTPLAIAQLEKVYHVFDVNVFGPLVAVQALVPHMRERGDGHIIFFFPKWLDARMAAVRDAINRPPQAEEPKMPERPWEALLK